MSNARSITTYIVSESRTPKGVGSGGSPVWVGPGAVAKDLRPAGYGWKRLCLPERKGDLHQGGDPCHCGAGFVCREPTSPGLPLCCVYLRRNDGETKGARELYTERMQGGTKRMQGRKKRMQRMQRMTKRTMAVLQPKYWLLAVLALVLVFAPVIQMGCGGDDTSGDTTTTEQTESASGGSDLILASTTSTQDSGLFEVLLPAFEEAYP